MRTFITSLIVSLLTMTSASSLAVEPAANSAGAKVQAELRKVCQPSPLAPGTNYGTLEAGDCYYGILDQPEDIYLVSQGRLKSSKSNQMATFSMEDNGFNWTFGLGLNTGGVFPDPVHASRRGPAGVYDVGGFSINTFSVIGEAPVYKMWVGGQDSTQLGDYSLTASVEPVSNTCERNYRVYLQGNVTFDADINNGNSCEGIIQFGPHAGNPLNYQYWWVLVTPGQTVTLNLSGVGEETMAAAIINWSTNQAELDLGDGAGDTDRSVTFTSEYRALLYVEVSSVPDVDANYTFSFESD